MNKIWSVLFIAILFTSCKGQEYEAGIFDLSKLDFHLNADQFYSKSMNRENIKMTSGKQYVVKDTIREYDLGGEGDRNKIFGIQFNVKSYSPEDTVAIYKNFAFSRLEAMTTEKGDLMLISATAKCPDKDFKEVIQKMTNEYKPPVIEEKEFAFFKSYHYTWTLKDRIIQLVSGSKLDFTQTPHNIIDDKEKKMISEVSKNKLEEIHVFICKKEFEKKLKGKMSSGEWSDFK
ncbi:hypothetical protein [Chryseobacterium vrystaatense]|uniref:Lipoprotein n=1 Tax=Chryseobacterium vrystaatense TaxID=307480 RepID=A0A1M5BT54_9FLAO|nr:hypothetical protein [Chryseobacterium vrystaatense]SHF45698.1 hypothetical protein SAMN02787073_2375 [Chryseobacterium vrystaatense]